MIKNITYNFYFFLFLFMFSCTPDSDGKEKEIVVNKEVESVEEQAEVSATNETDVADIPDTTTQVTAVNQAEELQEVHEEIEQKYGVQWDFCTCIVKSDSIDKAIGGENMSENDLDFLLERLDVIDEKCKGMLVQPNSTPKERNEHEKKVRECLK